MKKKYVLFIFIALFFCGSLFSQQKIFVIDSTKTLHKITEFTYTWEDNNLEKKASLFHEKKDIRLNQLYFCKVKIANPNKKELHLLLQFDDFLITKFEIFDENKNIIHFQKQNISKRHYLLPFTISQQDTITLTFSGKPFQNIQSLKPIYLKIIENKQEIDDKFDFYFFFHGAMWVMFFYNLFFYFMVRDRAYLYYSLYILCMTLVSVKETHFFVKANFYYYQIIISSSALCITIFYTQFIRYFLNISKINHKLDSYFSYWVYIRSVIISLMMLWYIYSPSLVIENDFILLIFILEIFGGLFLIYKSWKTQPISTNYIILGYIVMMFPLIIAIFKQVIYGEADPEKDGLLVQIGVLFELVIFSLGLGYRSKIAKQENLRISEENRIIIQEQNIVLEKKVNERTQKLNATLDTVSKQRDDIISSINYALRIQKAIIPKEEELQKQLECFVFFRPKDIVSGDFYWFAEKDNYKILAVGDCTGHGVSGAFMTFIGNNILNQIVHNFEIHEPNEILNKMQDLLQKTLDQSHGKVEDGMDICIIKIDKNQITYAGAMNPIYYVQNQELKQIKADKMPIGGSKTASFYYTNHTIEKNENFEEITFYLFSDGFQDQFGGEDNKKFLVGKFKKLLFELSTQRDMTKQKHILQENFDTWKGNYEQTDDVLVIGFKI